MSAASTTLESLYAAFEGGDIPAAVALMDPEIEWVEAAGHPYGGSYVGPDAVLGNVFARIGAEWDDFKAIPDYVVGDEERAVGVGTYSGTNKASGRSFEARFAHAVLVRDGRIVHFEQVADTALITSAL